ncbi:hypothetical protein CYMTET_39116 [Cymbomonas tetramitiformis]|uniref:Uncharacterized protein n=1 Tax=Cymbomonas tetramitiformis TaxID=36881 RepID=A0AAE0F4Z3_9CHLO|nr:hypothetical protein CYMTET_39116 [Cymbomonas tetramitiformis]
MGSALASGTPRDHTRPCHWKVAFTQHSLMARLWHRRVFLSSALRRSCHLVVVILRAGMYDSTDMSEPGNLRGRSCRWLLMWLASRFRERSHYLTCCEDSALHE